MLGLWLAAAQRKSPSISERVWKEPGWISTPCSATLWRALNQLPGACARFHTNLPRRAQSILAQMEITVRPGLDPAEACSMVPGRSPQNG
jgi:hypothetical protein